MRIVQEISSVAEENTISKDFEIYQFIAEKGVKEGYNSLTFNFAQSFGYKLYNLLNQNFKDFSFKALIIADEFKEIEIKKVIVLLPNKEMINFVRNSLTEKYIEVDLLEEFPKGEITTLFKQQGDFWCKQVHNYLKCEYNFNGLTKLNVAGHAGELVSFNFILSGKGTNDELVYKIKLLSQYVEANKAAYYSSFDELYKILEAYFKS
jgi:hypothetical protein